MAWYELNAWNVTGAAAEWTSRLNADIANKLSALVAEAKTQAAKQFLTAADNLAMADAWNRVTHALSSELTLAQQAAGNATIAQKLANARYALDNVDWLNNYTYTKLDGTSGTLGTTGQLGDVDLREGTFISQFTETTAQPLLLKFEREVQPAYRSAA